MSKTLNESCSNHPGEYLNSVSISEETELRMCRPLLPTREADACWLAPCRVPILSPRSADCLFEVPKCISGVAYALQFKGTSPVLKSAKISLA